VTTPIASTSAPAGYVVECDPCLLYGNQRLTFYAADHLAGQHDDTHHHGVMTAYVARERS